jgi:hypothetical protein
MRLYFTLLFQDLLQLMINSLMNSNHFLLSMFVTRTSMLLFAYYQVHTFIILIDLSMLSYTFFAIFYYCLLFYIFDFDVVSLPNAAYLLIKLHLTLIGLFHGLLELILILLMNSSNYAKYMMEILHIDNAKCI